MALLPHFTGEEVEAQKAGVICSQPHSIHTQDPLTSEAPGVSPSFTCAPHRRPSLLAIHHSWAPRPSVPGSPGSWPLASVCSASGGGLTGAWPAPSPLSQPDSQEHGFCSGLWGLRSAVADHMGNTERNPFMRLAWPPQLWGPSRGLLVGGWGRLPKVTRKVATGLGLNPSYMCSSSQYSKTKSLKIK